MLKTLKKETLLKIKFSIDVEINLVNGELPSIQIISRESNKIAGAHPGFEVYFICFYLPGMKLDAGAFATAHHNPKLKVNILDFVLSNYPEYSKLLEE